MKRILFLLLLISSSLSAGRLQEPLVIYNLRATGENEVLLISFDLDIHSHMVRPSEFLMLYPVLQSVGAQLILPPVELAGKKRSKVRRRYQALGGKVSEEALYRVELRQPCPSVLHYEIGIPLEDWMDNDMQIVFRHQLSYCRERFRSESCQYPAHIEIIRRSPDPLVAFAVPRLVVKERQEEGSAYLDFPSGQSAILPTYRRNPEELSKIREMIARTRKDEDITITGIYITGYASPEGSQQTNERLSGARAHALQNYLFQATGLPQSLFHTRAGGEDWKKLRELVEGFPLESTTRILSIIDNPESYDRKEQQLKGLGPVYQRLLNEVFPLLRRVEYQIRYRVRDYSVAEAGRLLDKDPGKLSPYEFYQLSLDYEPESREWQSILLLSAGLYPDDEVSQINAAAIHLMAGRTEEAKEYLDRLETSQSPAAWNNRGAWYMLLEEYDKAREYFRQAAAAGLEEAKENLGKVKN